MSTFQGPASDFLRLARGAARACRRAGRGVLARGAPERDRVLDLLGLVRRDDFETVRELAENARLENERLAKRVASLEAAKRKRGTTKRRGPAKKAASTRAR